MLRILRIFLEIVAGLVGVVVVFGLILIWRLSAGPVQSAIATPYLEAGIEGIVPGTHVKIAHTLLTWDNANHSVALHADGLRITERNGTVIAEVPNLDIRLSVVGVLFGQFLPIELAIDHPQIKLERRLNGSFTFGGMPTKGDSDDDESLKDGLSRIAHHLAHAAFTHKLQITGAVFDVHDVATNSAWSVHIPEIALAREHGDMNGGLTLDVAQKDKISTIDINYTYDRAEGLHRFVTRFSDIIPAFFAGGHPATLGLAPATMLDLPLTGEIALAFDSDINVAAGTVQLHGGSGFLNAPALWDKPRAVKSLDIKADYDRSTGHLELSSAAFDFGGPRLNLSATGKPKFLSSHKMDLTLAVQLDNWPMDQYAQLWPKPIISDARDWIAANLSKGQFDHGEGVFKGDLDLDDPANINFTEGTGKVAASGATVTYVDGMPPVEGVSAEGIFDLQHMTVNITGGGAGDIRLLPFTIAITGFEDTVQNIDIPLKVAGPIPSILRLIDQPPLGYAKKVGLTPEDVGGIAQGTVSFHFPLLKTLAMKDIDVKANAELSGVTSTKLVKGIAITQGNLALNLDPQSFEMKGPANLNAVPFQIDLKQNFTESKDRPYRQVALTGGLTAEQWHTLGIDVFDGTKGPILVLLTLVQPDKTATQFSGALDMTSADVRIGQLNWKKPANIAATLKFTAEQTDGNGIAIKSIDAEGPQLNIKGDAALTKNGDLSSLSLSPMIIGRTNASLHFSRSDKGDDALHFDAEGKAFDVSGLRGGKDPERSTPQPKEYRIEVGKLYTSENGFIENARGYAIRDPQGWSEISLHGLADGGHQLDIDLKKSADGGRNFTLSCDDFGKALKGMGFTDTVRDGKVYIYGESDPDDPRAIVGTATIGHFTVGHLPVLAVLMNAASPFGFAGLFSDSMEFDDLKGKFRWEGDGIRLIGIHASGAAVGINVSGRVDMSSGEADLHGTMVPFSVMNSVLNSIPLIGDLITGGKGQGVFAVSYSVSGPLSDPHIGVNPVSLLTPGFVRNLFFGDNEDEETPKDKPPASR